jgi:hypothetical protein
MTHKISLAVQTGQNRKTNKELEIEKKLTCAVLLLVRAVIKAGEVLDAYIRSHPEFPELDDIVTSLWTFLLDI